MVIAGCSGVFALRHFAVNTDTTALFPPNLPWAQRAFAYMHTFPEPGIIVAVDAPTPENVEVAASRLGASLAQRKEVIRRVWEPQGGRFFAHNALLYLPTRQVAQLTDELSKAAPVIAAVAADPSLRGALDALSDGLAGVNAGLLPLDALTRPLTMAADTAQAALAGRPAEFSWQVLASGRPPAAAALRRFIQIEPVLDYHALEPGRAATRAIAEAAHRLRLASDLQAKVRITGLVPINDEGFATLTKHAGLNAAVSLAAVGLILWLALRSLRIIGAVVVTIIAGLAVAAALGLLLVGALNLISVAFLVLFIGLGIDFGIQFSVRYRAERFALGDLRAALLSAARKAGPPLALAAAATAVGFASFLPTDYRGLSELGAIAGLGMVVAFFASVTLLPALLAIVKPSPEPRPLGWPALAPIDDFLARHRTVIVALTLAAVAAASPLLLHLSFDFNPLHLRDATAPAVKTFLALRKEPEIGANAIEIMTPDLDAANALARRLSALPEVAQARTLSALVPADQDRKLALIRQAARVIAPALAPAHTRPPPSDRQNITALEATAKALAQASAGRTGAGARAALRLSTLLTDLAQAPPAARDRIATAISEPLRVSLAALRAALDPHRVTVDTLPASLKRAWLAPDGRARVEVLPKGDPDNTAVLYHFVTAVQRVAPGATGPAVLLYEAGKTVVRAFAQAGIFAIGAILVLLAITLRRARDVVVTLLPLLVAGVVTLELATAFGLRFNFANIIALPLLLGVGVAFKIYYILAWRAGRRALVQSPMTRAVIFSAATTATAFGSLWMSSDPGTSSMGEMMALALVCTMTAAVLFQPALMGMPRRQPDAAVGEPRREPAILVERIAPTRRGAAQPAAVDNGEGRQPTAPEHRAER